MTEIIQIDSNTWSIEDGFVRFFLLVGEDKALMIDSGVNSPDAAQIAKTLTDKPVILLNTHGDGDHTSGTAGFDKIYMHEFDYIDGDIATRFPETELVKVKDGDVIDLGNRTLKLIHIPGHTRGSIAILDISKRVLYSGDSVSKAHIYMFGPKREPQSYAKSLDKLISIKDEYDYIYASHGDCKLDGDYALLVKEMWLKVCDNQFNFEEVDLFGMKVKSYTTDYCGFYLI